MKGEYKMALLFTINTIHLHYYIVISHFWLGMDWDKNLGRDFGMERPLMRPQE